MKQHAASSAAPHQPPKMDPKAQHATRSFFRDTFPFLLLVFLGGGGGAFGSPPPPSENRKAQALDHAARVGAHKAAPVPDGKHVVLLELPKLARPNKAAQ